MNHFKEIEHGYRNMIFNFGGTEPPFRANLHFGYAQSGSGRTSFSESTVASTAPKPAPNLFVFFDFHIFHKSIFPKNQHLFKQYFMLVLWYYSYLI